MNPWKIFYYQSRTIKDSKRIRLNFFLLRNFQRVFLLQWFVYVISSCSISEFHGVFETVAWLFASKNPSQIVEMSEQNEFNFRIMVISFPFVSKVLEKCRFVWGLSLFVVSLTLHRIALFLSVFVVWKSWLLARKKKKTSYRRNLEWNEFNVRMTV